MAKAPSSPLTLAVHRGRREIVTSTVTSLELAVELADTLAPRGGFVTVRDRGGRLVYAKSAAGQTFRPGEGSPGDLHGWSA